jgi:hypothetical protein
VLENQETMSPRINPHGQIVIGSFTSTVSLNSMIGELRLQKLRTAGNLLAGAYQKAGYWHATISTPDGHVQLESAGHPDRSTALDAATYALRSLRA